MIIFATGTELKTQPTLRRQMLRDRAEQFSNRLGWHVSINAQGEELDQYDALNPIYIISTDDDGGHQGSMRFLPTIGRSMVNEHFLHLNNGLAVRDPQIWECTRFCVSQRADKLTAMALMAAGGNLMFNLSLRSFVGVFDQRMERVYRRIGAPPVLLGSCNTNGKKTSLGLWSFSHRVYGDLLRRTGLSHAELELGFVNSSVAEDALADTG